MTRQWQQVSLEEAKHHPLYGVKNWLAVFAFGVLLIPLRELGGLGEAAHDAGMTLTQLLAQNEAFGTYVKAVLALQTLLLAVIYWLLFTKQRGFRVAASALLIGYWPAVAVVALATQAPGAGRTIGLGFISWLLTCAVWVTYLQRSRRVRVTFENCLTVLKAQPESLPLPATPQISQENNAYASFLAAAELNGPAHPVMALPPVEASFAAKFSPWVFGAVCLAALLFNILVKTTTAGGQSVDAPAPAPTFASLGRTDTKKTDTEFRSAIDILQENTISSPGLHLEPPVPKFADANSRQAYLQWLERMSEKLQTKFNHEQIRREFLQTVWYESTRQGLNPQLVLAVIATFSDFRKFYVSNQNARGYMGVRPLGFHKIGDEDTSRLFDTQPNIEFGCALLKVSLALSNGNVYRALLDYAAGNLDVEIDDQRAVELAQRTVRASLNWQ